jgi:hypothetical protein
MEFYLQIRSFDTIKQPSEHNLQKLRSNQQSLCYYSVREAVAPNQKVRKHNDAKINFVLPHRHNKDEGHTIPIIGDSQTGDCVGNVKDNLSKTSVFLDMRNLDLASSL